MALKGMVNYVVLINWKHFIHFAALRVAEWDAPHVTASDQIRNGYLERFVTRPLAVQVISGCGNYDRVVGYPNRFEITKIDKARPPIISHPLRFTPPKINSVRLPPQHPADQLPKWFHQNVFITILNMGCSMYRQQNS